MLDSRDEINLSLSSEEMGIHWRVQRPTPVSTYKHVLVVATLFFLSVPKPPCFSLFFFSPFEIFARFRGACRLCFVLAF